MVFTSFFKIKFILCGGKFVPSIFNEKKKKKFKKKNDETRVRITELAREKIELEFLTYQLPFLI